MTYNLTWKQRLDFLAHLGKAVLKQHHREHGARLAAVVPRNGVVIDVGAHAGQYSKLFARLAPEGQVHAFEPSSYAVSIFRPAMRFNGLTNVTLHQVGFADKPGELVLETPVKKNGKLGFGLARLALPQDGSPAIEVRREVVRVSTLDAFVAEAALTRVDFIKVDIEGGELRFLIGAQNTLAKFKPALLMEVMDRPHTGGLAGTQEIFSLLRSHGYSARRIQDDKQALDYIGPGDYLFTAEPDNPFQGQRHET